jgi:uncharacterized protein (TIGR03437 family)
MWTAGARKLVVLTLAPVAGNTTNPAALSFGDEPVTRETVNAGAGVLPTIWATGAVASVSAASFSGPELASESLAAAFGTNLTTATEVASTTPLPRMLAGTTVKLIDNNGAEKLSPLLFVSPGQINFQVPSAVAAGMASVVVTTGNGAIAIGALQIAPVAPGLFAANADGQGVAAAVVLRVRADGSQSYEPVARLDTAQGKYLAVPIDLGPDTDQVFLVSFGTGFRARNSLDAVMVRIGDIASQVFYAGNAPDFVGLDQLNVLLSRNLSGRGEVDVKLIVDGKPANIVRINIK